MDPDAALDRLRQLVKATHDRTDFPITTLEEFATTFEGLDEWLSAGNFPPKDWNHEP